MTNGVVVYEAIDDGNDFIFKDLNKGVEKLSKITKQEALGKRVSKLFPGVISSGLLKVFKFVWKTGKPRDLPVFRYKDHRIDQYVHNRVYKLPSGEIVAVYDDVTDKKKAEIRLKESEQKFRHIINDLDVGYFKVKISGEIILHNPAFKQFLGIPENYHIIGKNVRQFWINPDERKEYIERLNIYGSVKNFQITARKMNGERIFIQNSSHLIRNEKNGQGFIEGTFSDITDQILMEEKLKASEEKFRTVFEQSLIGLSIMKDFKVTYFNKANSYILGYDIEEIKDWKLREFIRIIHPDDSNKVLKRIKENFQNKNYPLKYQTRIITKSGEIKWVEVFAKFIGKKDENKVLNMVIDITDKKRAEQQLIKLNKLKSDLLSRTSHELKTPLVAMKGFVDLLLELYSEQLNEEMRSIVNEIQKGANRLENLIKDILKTSELNSDEVILEKQKVDLKKLIRETIDDLKILIETREHTIDYKLGGNLIIKLDKNKIKEVIDNLMSNAIKYTPKGGRIVINSEEKKDKILISISDNGIGLTKRDKENLFKQFGKIEKYGKGWDIDTEGTGLGLYISKQIIELHGGNIWATSNGVNQGSTFFFTLPKN
jgi:PAS domain S-box-containing protein